MCYRQPVHVRVMKKWSDQERISQSKSLSELKKKLDYKILLLVCTSTLLRVLIDNECQIRVFCFGVLAPHELHLVPGVWGDEKRLIFQNLSKDPGWKTNSGYACQWPVERPVCCTRSYEVTLKILYFYLYLYLCGENNLLNMSHALMRQLPGCHVTIWSVSALHIICLKHFKVPRI